MKTEDLKEYLSMLVDMEQDINLQNNLISDMRNKICQIESGQIQHCKEPVPPSEEIENPTEVNLIGSGFLFLLGVIFILSGSPGFIFGVFLMAVGVIIFVLGRAGDTDKNKKIKAQWDKYRQEKTAYARAVDHEQKQEKDNFIEKSVLQAGLQELETKNEQSKKTLQEIYSANIIFPKYRNFVMLCSLYEYLFSGRCKALEGYEGAYNLLEQEILTVLSHSLIV